VRNPALHEILQEFTAHAAGLLAAETAGGAEIPFEVVEAERRRGRVPLYCYRPLTDEFIEQRLGLLMAMPSYAPAARALTTVERASAYLVRRGEEGIPDDAQARADAVLQSFLRAVFAERSQFGFDKARFEVAYAELEETLYEGRSVATVIAPLLGIALDEQSGEVALGDGLSLIRGDALEGAPPETTWRETGEPSVLAMVTVTQDPMEPPPLSLARTRFRRLLTALRLFERGGYTLGPMSWTRTGTGPWRAVPFGVSGRPKLPVLIAAEQEDELRAFYNLVESRRPSRGVVAWALARFEMGCERLVAFEALTDYLLALRALLDPAGSDSRRLAERLAAICASPEQRSVVIHQVRRAVLLERAVISGGDLADPDADELTDQIGEHLSALLCDVLCGHLEPDLVKVADELLADASPAAEEPAGSGPGPAGPSEQPLAFPVAAPHSVP
jgi:hypothetical protein